MRLKFLPMFLASLILYGCEKSEEMDTSPGESPKRDVSGINFKALFSKDHTMKPAEAEVLALDAACMFYGSRLKAGRGKNIEKTTVIRNSAPVLKSTAGSVLPDTLAYVLNFADSAGFAVICADDRVGCPVLACTGSGVLDSAAIEENPGLAIFMENAEDYIVQKVREFEQSKDSLMAEAQKYLVKAESSDIQLKKIYTGGYTLWNDKETIIGPLVYTRWDQGYPYNIHCPRINEKRTLAGCFPVAVGQIMAYLKQPASLDGHVFNWEEMTSVRYMDDLPINTSYNNIAYLLSSIGINSKSDFGETETGTSSDNMMNWLKSIGFSTSSKDYSFENVKNSLDLNRPVAMTGYRNKKKHWIKKTTYKDGHAWVVDGYRTTKVRYETYRVNTDTEEVWITSSKPGYENSYLHNNWGWLGQSNGWFAEGCFNIQEPKELDSSSKSDAQYNYRYKLKAHTIWR